VYNATAHKKIAKENSALTTTDLSNIFPENIFPGHLSTRCDIILCYFILKGLLIIAKKLKF